MRPMSAVLFALLLGSLASARLPAQGSIIPPEVQAVLDKVKAHQPLTPEESRILQQWTFRRSNGQEAQPENAPTPDENPLMPRDVQEILARAQAGQLPTEAEKARLKTWATQIKAHKAQLIQDAMRSGSLLQSAVRAGGPQQGGPHPSRPSPEGSLGMHIIQTVKGSGGEMTYTAVVQIPILVRLKNDPNGKVPALHLQWWINPQKQGSLDYHAEGWGKHSSPPPGCDPHEDHLSASVKATANGLGGKLLSHGQIVAPLGRRSFIDATFTSMAMGDLTVACRCGGGTHPAPPVLLPLTFDGARGDVPFDFGVGYLPPVPSPWKDKLPGPFQAMLNQATFDFDAGALRQAMAKGGPFQASATYHWHLKTPEGESDSRTSFHFVFNLPPPETGGIVVNPDPPQRGDAVSIEAHVPGATRFHWTLTPKAAGNEPPPPVFQSDADHLSFIALADFSVAVQPYDASGPLDPPPSRDITVTPRPWKTARIPAREKTFVHPLMLAPEDTNGDELQPDGDLHLGESACAVDEGQGMVQNRHWIHHPHGSLSFHFPVREGGYEDARVPSGPWAAYFYVKDQGLKVQRVRLINADLEPGSALWRANQAAAKYAPADKKPDIQSLLDELRDHEQAHDTLAFEALAKADPAPKIEKLIGTDEHALLQLADAVCGDADTQLSEASDHAHVKALLMKAWNHSGCVLLPEPGGGYRTFFIANYAGLGLTPP